MRVRVSTSLKAELMGRVTWVERLAEWLRRAQSDKFFA